MTGSDQIPAAAFTPSWLSPDDVKDWLRVNREDPTDDDLITRVTAMAEPYVMRCRPEFLNPDGTYTPDVEAYQGGVMYAAREYQRRNSPAGVEMLGDATSFIARFDVDIDRALHTGNFAGSIIA